MRIQVGLLLFALLGVPVAVEAQEPSALLKQAQTLRCFFQEGYMVEWLDGAAVGRGTEIDDTPVLFDRIDREAGSARMIAITPTASPQLADVAVVVFDTGPLPRVGGESTYGLTFIEVSRAGSVNITTVWSPADLQSTPAEPLTYPAVYSHHIAIDRPIPSQFPGWCRVEG